MADLGDFDATKVDPTSTFEAIPAGKYRAVIIESQTKETKSGTGEYLELKWVITDGEFAKRNLWSRLNLKNKSQQAMEIAYRELSAICHATGIMQPKDSNALHRLPVLLTVGTRDYNGQVQNEIKGYDKVPSAAEEAEAKHQEQQAGAGGDDAGDPPPWAR